jgi:hypothetical protein
MAEQDLKGAASAGTPTNPLSRPYWTQAYADSSEHDTATLAGLTTAIHALARILANNEALRELHANSEPDDLECVPLDAAVTEGLFAALYFLSEQAQLLSQPPESTFSYSTDVSY